MKRNNSLHVKKLTIGLAVASLFLVIIAYGANKDSVEREKHYTEKICDYNSETEKQKHYSMKRYVGTESTLRDAPECFGLENFLYNYNEVAKYKLDSAELKDLKSHKVQGNAYARLTNYALAKNYYLTGTDSSLCGYEVRVEVFFHSDVDNANENDQEQIIYDCIHAIDRNIEDKWIDYEINQVRENGTTVAYFNELFRFEAEQTEKNAINFIILYNPVSPMLVETWEYDNYKMPDYR